MSCVSGKRAEVVGRADADRATVRNDARSRVSC